MDNIQETADYKVYVLDGADLSSDILMSWNGADNTGETDSTNMLKLCMIPVNILSEWDYRFNGETLNLSGG